MTVARIVPALTLMACLAAPALAQAPSRSLPARVGALEKENAALRGRGSLQACPQNVAQYDRRVAGERSKCSAS